jgi:hypothetical protein
MDNAWWENLEGNELSQGDYLRNCPVLVVLDSFDPICRIYPCILVIVCRLESFS